jgi:hypothetical protein
MAQMPLTRRHEWALLQYAGAVSPPPRPPGIADLYTFGAGRKYRGRYG